MSQGTNGQNETVRPDIALSWQRSAQSGLAPDAEPIYPNNHGTAMTPRLLTAAAPILEDVAHHISDTEITVLLGDRNGIVFSRVCGSAYAEKTMDNVGAVVGVNLSEESAGTNALGTPIEVLSSFTINGEEHYLERLKSLSCYGLPIIHPLTKRLEGVIDIADIAPLANKLFIPFLARTVEDIENRLLEGSRVSERKIMDAFQHVSPNRHVAVTAMGEDLLLSNKVAADILSPSDHAILRNLASERSNKTQTIKIALSSGITSIVKFEEISGSNGAVLFQIEPEGKRHYPIPRKHHKPETVESRIQSQVEELQRISSTVMISGETGSGRTTVARQIAAAGSVQVMDCSQAAIDGTERWLRTLLEKIRTVGLVLIIENIHLLSPIAIPIVADFVTGKFPARLIITGPEISELPQAISALVSKCPEFVNIPPLRKRTSEIHILATEVLKNQEQEDVKMTPALIDTLGAHTWPGNMTELVSVLNIALRNKNGTRIDVTDLPSEYAISRQTRELSGLGRAERNAIIEALRESGGNKAHASDSLGMSRTTLYSRIRKYGIVV